MRKFLLITALAGFSGLTNAQVFPEIYTETTDNATEQTGIYSSFNLIANPGFEIGETLSATDLNPSNWTCSMGFATGVGQIRSTTPPSGAQNEGAHTLLWRDDAWSLSGVHMYQKLTGLEPNTSYKVKFAVFVHAQKNNIRNYYAGVGITENGMELIKSTFTSKANEAVGTKTDVVFTFTTPDEVPAECYFTISNQTFTQATDPTANNSYRIIQLDRMTMVKEISIGKETTINVDVLPFLQEGDLKDVESLKLEGEWTKELLEGGLNDALKGNSVLTTVDMEDGASNIIDASGENIFATCNPNCLIFLQDGTATSWKNAVVGTAKRIAAEIVLRDNYSFNSKYAFTAKKISYTCSYVAGISTICLPFVPTDLSDINEFDVQSATKANIEFNATSTFVANAPYLLKLDATGEKVFTATDAEIIASSDIQESTSDFKANFELKTVSADDTDLYILSGTGFVKAQADEEILPFTSYFKTTTIAELALANPTVNPKPVSVDNSIADNALKIYSLAGGLSIEAASAQTIQLYDCAGCLVRTVSLVAGVNAVKGLVAGLYMMNNQKVVVR